MSYAWINLSSRWGLTSVQAALNVVISVLGSIGIWAFSRYWWQRGGKKVLKSQTEVPLPQLLSLAGPGEGYDLVTVLKWKIFSRQHWILLLQLFVIFLVTLACMLAGPIAKVSLRSSRTVNAQMTQVLQAWNSANSLGNRLMGDVDWSNTMQSLDEAGFPYDRLMDYLPPTDLPWKFVPSEWDSAWFATCNFQNETMLDNVEATGNGTIKQPIDAFPTFAATYDKSWLDASQYRVQTDFNGERYWSESRQKMTMKESLMWVLVQSDPMVNDRMYTNNATLRLSISALHAKNYTVVAGDNTQAGVSDWRPIGAVQNASYSRVECEFTRRPGIIDIEAIPWPWTNDTYSITYAYRTLWTDRLGKRARVGLGVASPSPYEILRFYQAYMVSVNTWTPRMITQSISMWEDTVQISATCLILVLLLVLVELLLSARYFWFLRKHKRELASTCIPDGKMDWMIYNAKLSEQHTPLQTPTQGQTPKDRDYFRRASFGNMASLQTGPRGLARVYTSPAAVSKGERVNFRDMIFQKKAPPSPRKMPIKADEESLTDTSDKIGDKRQPSKITNLKIPSLEAVSHTKMRASPPSQDSNLLRPVLSSPQTAPITTTPFQAQEPSPRGSLHSAAGTLVDADAVELAPLTFSTPTRQQRRN